MAFLGFGVDTLLDRRLETGLGAEIRMKRTTNLVTCTWSIHNQNRMNIGQWWPVRNRQA